MTLFQTLKAEHEKVSDIMEKLEKTTEEKTRDITLEAYEEHALCEHLISQLDALEKSDETWTAKFSALKELVEHHVEEEEGDMFKKMRKTFEKSDFEAMNDEFSALKKRFKLTIVSPAELKKAERKSRIA
ncbi:MAG: hypothetical protein H7222_15415 [Methylotenera sp.]|nr:hypothetical protein [Oligoflexia bacterium]